MTPSAQPSNTVVSQKLRCEECNDPMSVVINEGSGAVWAECVKDDHFSHVDLILPLTTGGHTFGYQVWGVPTWLRPT